MKRLSILIACISILTITGCEAEKETQVETSSVSTTIYVHDPEGTMDPLEKARQEYGRTPDMTYYTYYFNETPPEEEQTPW